MIISQALSSLLLRHIDIYTDVGTVGNNKYQDGAVNVRIIHKKFKDKWSFDVLSIMLEERSG